MRWVGWAGLAVVLGLALCGVQPCSGQLNLFGGGEKAVGVKTDVPYILCQMCQAFVKQAISDVKGMRKQVETGKKLEEYDILERMETMCDTDKPSGVWLTNYDLVESGTELKMTHMGQTSRCNSECATMSIACKKVVDEIDLTRVSEMLYKGEKRAPIANLACPKFCRTPPPPLPADRPVGPEHEPMSLHDLYKEAGQARAAEQGADVFDSHEAKRRLQQLESMLPSKDDDVPPELREDMKRRRAAEAVDSSPGLNPQPDTEGGKTEL